MATKSFADQYNLPKIPNNLACQLDRFEEWVREFVAARRAYLDVSLNHPDDSKRISETEAKLCSIAMRFSGSDAESIIWNGRKMIEFGLQTEHPYMREIRTNNS